MGEDAGEIGEDGISNDDEVAPPWVEEEEEWDEGEGAPVAEFAAPSFLDEAFEVGDVSVAEFGFGEAAAEPCCGVGELVFPRFDEERIFVKATGSLKGSGGWWVKPLCRHAGECPCETHLDDGPGDDVGEGDEEHGW